MFDGRWREAVDRTTRPVGQRLARMGVTADVLTGSGLVFAVATAVVVATGHLRWAIPLLVLTGFHDLLDGPVAKTAGTASVRGAFFDSVTDRVADAVLLGGVAWYLVSVREGELALLPLAVLAAASFVSYERAKAEALGLRVANGGVFGSLMERAERMILLGVGFLATWLLVPVLWTLLGLTLLTAVARFARVWRAAEGPARRVPAAKDAARASRAGAGSAEPTSTPARWREGAAPARWREWREASAGVPRTPRHATGELTARWRARRQDAVESRPRRAVRARARRQERADRLAGRVTGGRRKARAGQGGVRWGGGPWGEDPGRRRERAED